MANSIAVSITADVADLQVKRAIMSAELKAATADLNKFAKEAAASGSTDALREGMLASASAAQTAKTAIAGINAEMKEMSAVAEPAVHEAEHGFAALSASISEAGIHIRETVGMVGEMREAMMAFGEAMIAAFAVEKIADWAKEMGESAEKTEHLAQTFGMTVAQVQGLQAAAAATGMSVDTLTKGMGILDKNMIAAASGSGTASQAFKALGISASDGRNQMQLLLAIADKFSQMADGPKKVAFSMELFGKAGKEMIPFLNMGAAGLEKLDLKNQEYAAGVMVATAANKELQDWLTKANTKGVELAESTNESTIAMQGLGNVMTDAFAPVLKEATDSLNSMIRGFIESYREGGVVKDMMDALAGVMRLIGEAFTDVGEIIMAFGQSAVDVGIAVGGNATDEYGNKVPKSLHSMTEVVDFLRSTLIMFKDAAVAVGLSVGVAFVQLKDLIAGACKVMYDSIAFKWGEIESDWHNAMANIAADAEKQAGRVKAAWNEATAAFHGTLKLPGGASEGGVAEPKGSRDYNPNLAKPGKAKKAKADSEDKDDSATTDLQEAQDDAKAKLAIAESNATTIEALAKASAESQLAAVEKAEKQGVITKKQAAAQRAAILDAEVQAEITAANTIYQAKVSELRAEEAAEVASLTAKQQALDKSVKDYATKYQNLQNQIEAYQIKWDDSLNVLAVQHENQLTLIKAKGIADRERLIAQGATNENRVWQHSLQQFSMGIAEMITAQKSFMQTLADSWHSALSVVDKVISQIITHWIEGLLVKEGATKAADQKDTLRDAMAAARGAYKAMVGIPVIGPVLAPPAAAVAFAAVEGFSAAGGWDIPSGLNPMTQLHQKEMVLPAQYANVIRGLAANGNDSRSSGSVTHIHNWNISTPDARATHKLIMDNKGSIAEAMRSHIRYGGR